MQKKISNISYDEKKSIVSSVEQVIIANLLVKFGPMLDDFEKENFANNYKNIVPTLLNTKEDIEEAKKIANDAVKKIAHDQHVLPKYIAGLSKKLGVFSIFKTTSK